MDDATTSRTRPARISPSARTNLPRWPPTVPSLPVGAHRWVVADLGAPEVAARWGREGREMTGGEVDIRAVPMGDPDVVLQPFADGIAAVARVGTRVAVCGPEADVLLLRAGLLERGFLDEEVFAHATSIDVIRVRCAHCGRIARHRARPGDVVNCHDCSYDEVVHHHFSRRLAAYLAFRVDAEQGPIRPGEAADDRG